MRRPSRVNCGTWSLGGVRLAWRGSVDRTATPAAILMIACMLAPRRIWISMAPYEMPNAVVPQAVVRMQLDSGTMTPSRKLPATGALPRPENPGEAREVLKAEAFAAPNVQLVTMTGTEFTSICPRTGQPDFGTVIIEYEPAK